jgi:hypothetical protein
MILARTLTRLGRNDAALTGLSLIAVFLLQADFAHGQKPAEWDDFVRSAAGTPPTFWLNGDPSSSLGDIELDHLLRYTGGEWTRLEDGPWDEAGGSFGLPAEAENGVQVANSKQTDIGCSEEGSLAVLFRAPSSFDQNEPHVLIARGTYGAMHPFELSINRGHLRLAYTEAGNAKLANLTRSEEGAWCWVGLTWQKVGDSTEIAWRVWTRADGLSQGALNADQAGSPEHSLSLAGRGVRCTVADGVLSQVIVWDKAIDSDGWSKLEALLSND